MGYIRSTKCSLKFLNEGKMKKLANFLDEYRKALRWFIDKLWDEDGRPSLYINKSLIDEYKDQTSISIRALCCAGKQACNIIYGIKKKNLGREYIINKYEKENKDRSHIKFDKISKPIITDNFTVILDQRFISFKEETQHFDLWIKIRSLSRYPDKIFIPTKKTRHFNKLAQLGKLSNSIGINNKFITFFFEYEGERDKEKTAQKEVLGIDIGMKSVFSASDGQQITADNHGH